jgi:hypothetical protein
MLFCEYFHQRASTMTNGYSTFTKQETLREIKAIRAETDKITSTRKGAISFLIKAGILDKDGKRLARQYR